MNRAFLLAGVLLLLTQCGVQRPLIAPKDIPAHEERIRRKQERLEDASAQPPSTGTPAVPPQTTRMPSTDAPIAPSEFPAAGGRAD